MEFKFNPVTLDILLKHGWAHDRHVDIRAYEHHFAETHQPTSALVFAFLRSFGGLKVKGILVDPLASYRTEDELVRKYYEKFTGKPLCMVGWLGKPRSDSHLFMTMTGEIYSAWSDYVHLWGTTIEEAFDNILVTRNFTVIPIPPEMIPPKPQPPSPPPEGTDFGVRHNKDWTPVFQTVIVRGLEFTMCKVPPGTFRMGSDTRYQSEPIHDQYMTQSYWISVHLVTNAQWQQAVQHSAGAIQEPRKIDGYNDPDKAQHPVVWIDWDQCQGFVNWLGAGWRLPTEAEWEFAARGPDSLIDPLNGREQGATWVGAQDIGGRSWEWTSSLYKEYPYNAADGRENLTDEGCRTLRNAGWQALPSVYANASTRSGRFADASYKNIGVRVCITEL